MYPAIDPQPLYDSQAYSGKIVLVTGVSRRIGQEIALQYARTGAALAIVARSEEALGEAKRAILEAVPAAKVLVIVADARDTERRASATSATCALREARHPRRQCGRHIPDPSKYVLHTAVIVLKGY